MQIKVADSQSNQTCMSSSPRPWWAFLPPLGLVLAFVALPAWLWFQTGVDEAPSRERERASTDPVFTYLADRYDANQDGKISRGEYDRDTVDLDVQHMSYFAPFGRNHDMFDDSIHLSIYGSVTGKAMTVQDDEENPHRPDLAGDPHRRAGPEETQHPGDSG